MQNFFEYGFFDELVKIATTRWKKELKKGTITIEDIGKGYANVSPNKTMTMFFSKKTGNPRDLSMAGSADVLARKILSKSVTKPERWRKRWLTDIRGGIASKKQWIKEDLIRSQRSLSEGKDIGIDPKKLKHLELRIIKEKRRLNPKNLLREEIAEPFKFYGKGSRISGRKKIYADPIKETPAIFGEGATRSQFFHDVPPENIIPKKTKSVISTTKTPIPKKFPKKALLPLALIPAAAGSYVAWKKLRKKNK